MKIPIPSIQEIYARLSRLPKREKTILYSAAFLVIVAMVDRFIIFPVASRIEFLNKEIERKEEGIKRDLRILSVKDRIAKESSKYSSFFQSAKSDDEENTAILKEVEILANKSSVYLVDIKPAGVKETESVKKFTINLNCEAQMEQLIDFMYNIENSAQLLIIDKFQVSQKSSESSVARCTMTISKMALL